MKLSGQKISQALSIIIKKLYSFVWKNNPTITPSHVTLTAIDEWLSDIGITQGSTLFVHSSWARLNSGKFSAPELVKMMINKVGKTGTLLMPAFPQIQDHNKLFDVKRTPSGAGILTEVFRRYPGVKRSINLNHSVCALGGSADYLVGEHCKSETSWDEYSPYYRLGQIADAWIVGLGVGHRLEVATSLHCVESVLWKRNKFYKKLFKNRVCYDYKDENGNISSHCYRQRTGEIFPAKIARYFTEEELKEDVIEGLEVYAIKASTLINKSIELGIKGKTMYIWPIPFWWYFN